ncbi:response regulator [Paenibacillus sp. sgz500958]|uniref:response regulator transcription factor n=1 Tax=Paenibacillus sp. sgz500958 TaxID=3242475 RepID=UPI0036D38EBA
MYRILIVDDERIEREGIQHLIQEHNLGLETILAENGEIALEILEKQKIDILITDIKMPFMDGLELSEKVSEIGLDIEMIIFSAYHEFEYARRALRTNISNYLLKPIQITEFLSVVKQAIKACEDKEVKKLRNEQLVEGYNRGLVYEKEKMLLDSLNGVKFNTDVLMMSPELLQYANNKHWLHMILVDCGRKFFDIHNDEFIRLLNDNISYEFDYVNLNEHQSMVFVKYPSSIHKETLRGLGDKIIRSTAERLHMEVGLVIGKAVNQPEFLYDAYCEMEQMLEFKFFMDDYTILFADEPFEQARFEEIELNPILDKVYQCLEYNDLTGAEYSIELLFSYLKTKGQFSSLYTKFICSEIMKKVVTREKKHEFMEINQYLDKIYRTVSLQDLKNTMFTILSIIETGKGVNRKNDSNLRLIRTIKDLITEEYDQDLSLEGIAEQVYLTPSYLSYLFKKETGQSLIRYITQVRMEKAVELLTTTNMKIVEIYKKLGYRSSTYFIQTFRNFYGVTPAKFREGSP